MRFSVRSMKRVAWATDIHLDHAGPEGGLAFCERVRTSGAEVVVAEAMRFAPIEALPEERRFILDYHIDTRLLGAKAAEWGTKTLVLTHLIPAPETDEDVEAYEADIRAGGFDGVLVVANDLDEVVVG